MAILGGPTRGRRSHAIFWLAVMGLAAACGDNTAAGSNADAGAPGGASGDASVGTAGRAGSSSGGASGSGGAGAGAGGAAGQAGTGGAHPGRDAGACSTLPTCADMDASSCPRHHPECISGMCCQFSAEAPDCVECTCDSQCPSRAPYCESGRCTACLSKADCPPGMCCGVPVSGGPHACMTMNCVN